MTAPKPAGPDPAAVRAALAEIDATRIAWDSAPLEYGQKPYTTPARGYEIIIAAARAWLEQQETNE